MAGDPLEPSTLGDLEQAQRIHLICEEFEARVRWAWPRASKSILNALRKTTGPCCSASFCFWTSS